MGRKERRMLSKQQRREREQQWMSLQDIKEFKRTAYEKSNKYVMENIMPVFILYLVEHFRCKNDGVMKFMDWFNAMQEWLDKYPAGFEEIKKDLWEKAGVRIEY